MKYYKVKIKKEFEYIFQAERYIQYLGRHFIVEESFLVNVFQIHGRHFRRDELDFCDDRENTKQSNK